MEISSLLQKQDPEIAEALRKEVGRQKQNIVLIASENYVSKAVLEMMGSPLTNKYAEGYPGKRYYGGCQFVDVAETIAIERAKQLYGAEHANVQPHSGAQANMAVYFGLLETGATVLGMQLDQGGHLTHGSPVNFSGKYYKFISYGVDRETETLDYDNIRKLAKEHKPKLIVAGATAYPRIIDFKKFKEVADEVGAMLMVDMAHPAGIIAAGLHPSPVPYADVITSSTHKTLRGPRGGMILSKKAVQPQVDKGVFPMAQGGPLMHIVAAKAVAFGEALKPDFKAYQQRVIDNAKTLASELQKHGLRIVSNGTDNHLMLVDLNPINVTGQQAEQALESVGIVANKNAIPFDTKPARVTSGIRLGTPATTTRGFGKGEMEKVARLITTTLKNIGNEKELAKVREEVQAISSKFPVPGLE